MHRPVRHGDQRPQRQHRADTVELIWRDSLTPGLDPDRVRKATPNLCRIERLHSSIRDREDTKRTWCATTTSAACCAYQHGELRYGTRERDMLSLTVARGKRHVLDVSLIYHPLLVRYNCHPLLQTRRFLLSTHFGWIFMSYLSFASTP